MPRRLKNRVICFLVMRSFMFILPMLSVPRLEAVPRYLQIKEYSLSHLCQSLYRSLHKMFSYLIQAALLQALYYISFHFVSHNNQQKMNIPNLPFSIPNWPYKDFDECNERLLYHNFCSPLLLAGRWYFVGIATLKFDSVYLWPG